MKLYDINKEIESLIDSETGEISDFEAFESLQMEKEEKLENLALWYKDLIAEAKAIKEEKAALADRQKATENKAENVKRFLEYALNGEKFKTARVVVNYRKSQKVSINEEFIEWAKSNAEDLLTYTEPKANLTAIKEAIKNGREVKNAVIEDNTNINIK